MANDFGGWDDLLPFQSLEWPDPARLTPSVRPIPEPQGYVQHLSAGGWPDVTEAGVVRDARGERWGTRAEDNRTTLVTSPLADRDGYTGVIPTGSGVRLPPIAQPDAGAQPAGGSGRAPAKAKPSWRVWRRA